MDSRLVSTSGHLLMQSMKLNPTNMCVPAQDLASPTLELYHSSSVKTTSVKLQADSSCHWTMSLSSTLVIQSGMVRDVGITVLAVNSTTHHGSASNSLSRQ